MILDYVISKISTYASLLVFPTVTVVNTYIFFVLHVRIHIFIYLCIVFWEGETVRLRSGCEPRRAWPVPGREAARSSHRARRLRHRLLKKQSSAFWQADHRT